MPAPTTPMPRLPGGGGGGATPSFGVGGGRGGVAGRLLAGGGFSDPFAGAIGVGRVAGPGGAAARPPRCLPTLAPPVATAAAAMAGSVALRGLVALAGGFTLEPTLD